MTTLRCKPGDLAVVCGVANPQHIGDVVEVIRPYDECFFGTEPAWVVRDSGGDWHCRDDCLRPIRPQADDAQDEMLRPLPQGETV